jgi:uncharacterized protein YfkK (UPF0435 family)
VAETQNPVNREELKETARLAIQELSQHINMSKDQFSPREIENFMEMLSSLA